MVTRKASKPAGRGVKDEEVKSAHHDEILNWLIENLDTVVADRWGMSTDALDAALSKAKKDGLDWLQNTVVRKLNEYADGTRKLSSRDGSGVLRDETKALLLQALQRNPKVKKAVADIQVKESDGDAMVQAFEVMKQVERVEQKGSRYDPRTVRTPTGFVDLEAVIFLPERLRITIPGISGDEEYESTISGLRTNEQLAEAVKSFTPNNVGLTRYGARYRLWFSVRTSAFTLGEILQELKELRSLESGTSLVALVVDGIDPRMRELIERESFTVIDRDDYRQ